jgi:hypothetical protein
MDCSKYFAAVLYAADTSMSQERQTRILQGNGHPPRSQLGEIAMPGEELRLAFKLGGSNVF